MQSAEFQMTSFAALTVQEEEAGLYRDPSRIGLRVQWLILLRRMGLAYEGHSLILVGKELAETAEPETEPTGIERHRTAIKRYDLSKPVKQLLERGLLKKNDTFFDYGCGHGMDIEALHRLGYEASGSSKYGSSGTVGSVPTSRSRPKSVNWCSPAVGTITSAASPQKEMERTIFLPTLSSTMAWRHPRESMSELNSRLKPRSPPPVTKHTGKRRFRVQRI